MNVINYESKEDQDLVTDAWGVGTAIFGMHAAGDILIKIDGEPWIPKLQNEEGDDIWNHTEDDIWDVLHGRKKLTIEIGDLEEDKKLAAIQQYYSKVKKYGEDNIAYKFWREMGVNWCTHKVKRDYKVGRCLSRTI